MEYGGMDIDWAAYLNDRGDEFGFAGIGNLSGDCASGGLDRAFVGPAMGNPDVEAEHTASASGGYLSGLYTSDVLDVTTIDPLLLYPHHSNLSDPPLQRGHTNIPDDNYGMESRHIDSPKDPVTHQHHIVLNRDHHVLGNTLGTATRVKKSRTNLPKAAVAILKEWLFEHESDPYPSEAEKLDLSARSGLHLSQVNHWFMNARKRTLHSGYESSTSLSESESVRSTRNVRGQTSQGFGQLRRNSSNESLYSSALDSDSGANRPPRRGRKRRYLSDVPVLNHKRSRSVSTMDQPVPDAKHEPMFQCTFCGMELTSKSWRRHEETQHAPQVCWTCMATGSTLETHGIDPRTKVSVCAFCGDVIDGFCPKPHRIADCQTRKEDERVFHRKEHLRQHFRNFHPESNLTDQVAAAWKSVPNNQPRFWTCGFCGQQLGNWNLRESHVAQHFREGATIQSWNFNRARRYCPNTQDNVLGADVPLEDHGFRILCPHLATENDSIPVIKDLKAYDPRICGIEFPLDINFHLPQASNWASMSSVIWYCNQQSSLILHTQHEGSQVWLRYSLASLNSAARCTGSLLDPLDIPTHRLWIIFDQKPDVFIQGVKDPWVDGNPASWSKLKLGFVNTETSIAFLSWLSTATFSAVPRLRVGFGCSSCVLSFPSGLSHRNHQLFHEGAYVDIFGCRLGSATRATVEDLVLDFDPVDFVPTHSVWGNEVLPQPVLDNVEFRCGSSLTNGNSWGCRKIFAGLSAFAEHLKSSVGSICWTPLLTCAAISLQSRLDLAYYTAHSGLPAELFKLYPALKRVAWHNLAGATHFSETIPYSEQSDALSTIASVSTRSDSSSMMNMRMQSGSTFLAAKKSPRYEFRRKRLPNLPKFA